MKDFECLQSVPRLFCYILAASLAFPTATLAQTATGTISGSVRDSSQAAVVNATITLRNIGTNEARTVASNNIGYYTFQLLPPATYRLEAEMPGFRHFVRQNVKLDVAVALTVDVELQVGAADETITVTDVATPLDSSSSSLGQVVENKGIMDLPMNGRNSYAFAALVPGVNASAGFTSVQFDISTADFLSINGSRVNASQFYLDGGANSTTLANGPGIFPSLESVEEYKVQTNNYSAEFGNSSGGVINVVSKSGTNKPHGSLFEFLRNDKLDANNFFSNAAGIPIAPIRFNQFGAAFGGPVLIPKVYDGRNHTWFFFSYEGLRWVRPITATGTMPSALQHNGDFSQPLNSAGNLVVIYDPATTVPNSASPGQFLRTPFPGNVIPHNRMDPVALNIVPYTPMPNTTGARFTGANNFNSNYSAPIVRNTYSIKIDHSFTDNQKLSFRYPPNREALNRPMVYGAAYGPANVENGNDSLHNYGGVLNYTWVVSPTTVLELSSSVVDSYIGRISTGLNFDPVKLGFPSYFHQIPLLPCFPNITATGYGVTFNLTDNGGGFVGYSCNDTSQSYPTFHEYGNFTKVRGAHTIKIGANMGDARWSQRALKANSSYAFGADFTDGPNPTVASSVAGNAWASFLMGTGDSGSIANVSPGQFVTYQYYGVYFQDNWKLTPRLTLNLGLRYDYNAPWTEKHNRMNSWDGTSPVPLTLPGLTLHGGLVFPGLNGVPRGEYNPDKTNFAPRFGFGYSVDSKTALRGGYGIFYNAASGAAFTGGATVAASGFSTSTSWVSSVDGVTPTNYLSNPFPNGFQTAPGSSQGLLTLLGQSVSTKHRGRSTAYAEQWNFAVQRVLPQHFSIEVAYAGSHGVHLQGQLGYDQLPDQYLAMGTALRTLVTNPFYGIVSTGTLASATVQQGQLLRPYPQFTGITTIDSYGDSIYHSLQAKLERRFSGGLSLLVSYTFSKMIDDVLPSTFNGGEPGLGITNTNIQDNYNVRASRAVASFDIPQYLAINSNWELPVGKDKHFLNAGGWTNALAGGWQFNGLANFHAGIPLGLTTATNSLNNYGNAQLANYVGGNPNGTGPISQRVNNYFNTGAFAIPALYTYGNTGRLLPWLRAPGVANLDLSLFKNIPVHEQVRAQFRFEVFNLFNRPQFGTPGTTIGSSTAGVISSQANAPRDVQVALKFIF